MARFVLVVAVLAVSTSAPLVRAAQPTPALTFAALRVLFAALILAVSTHGALAALATLPRRELGLACLAGLLLGGHFGVWITSLYLTSTAASVALVATQPVFAAVLGRLFLGDEVGRREMIGIFIAAIGCAILAGGDWTRSRDAVIGDALAVLGAALAAAYLVVGRRMRVAIALTPYLALVNVVAGVGLLVAALLVDPPMLGWDAESYVAIGACAALGSVLGHTLLNWSVRRIPAHLVTLAILGEPVGASLLTWIFFAEQPPFHAVAGGAVILVGIALGFARTDRLSGTEAASRQFDKTLSSLGD